MYTMDKFSEWLFEWFLKRIPKTKLRASDNLFEIGAIDSLGIIELIEDMEKSFSVRFSEDDFQDDRLLTISGLVQILVEKHNYKIQS